MSAANGLKLADMNDDLKLTEIENNIIAQRILFQKIYQLPKSRMSACKDKLINIPISPEDVINSVESMPRTPLEAGLIEVKLKRKMEYKNVHKQSYVDPSKIYRALDHLKSNGHPHYQFYDDYATYKQRCDIEDKGNKLIFINEDETEEILDLEEYYAKKKHVGVRENRQRASLVSEDKAEEILDLEDYNAHRKANDILEDKLCSAAKDGEDDQDCEEADEEEYRKKDPIRKYQIDYGKSICLVDKFPESCVDEAPADTFVFAPGEGKIPENILQTKNWDTLAFPMKHADGKNGIDQTRRTRLTDQYYFVQRLRNADTRFSEDPAYVFAAASYIEKKQLQRNVNVSFMRGKEKTSDTGYSTYSLDDGFSVFENISNTPKYWKKAKNEMFAKLDNLGPFHFFFTLSCADLRWDENFSCILRKLGVSVVYSLEENGSEEVKVKIKNPQNETEFTTKSLDDYIKEDANPSYHELLRTHVATATQIYSQRVKSFIRDIMLDKNNPMCVEYYTTKVEFQGRGAPHNHGTIWINMNKMEFQFSDNKGKLADFDDLFEKGNAEDEYLKMTLKEMLKDTFVDGFVLSAEQEKALLTFYRKYIETEDLTNEMEKDAMVFFYNFLKRFPMYGLSSAFKKFQSNEELLPHEEDAVIQFSDKFTTCTLNIYNKDDD